MQIIAKVKKNYLDAVFLFAIIAFLQCLVQYGCTHAQAMVFKMYIEIAFSKFL